MMKYQLDIYHAEGFTVTLNEVVAVLPLVSVANKLIVLLVADVTFGAVAETC
ncbi:hypothetical protein ACVNPX_02080 [Staphylococcus aureus]